MITKTLAFGVGRYDWSDKLNIVSYAFENGIRIFDTAESCFDPLCGHGSENILSSSNFTDMIISTKFSPNRICYIDVVQSAENSLHRLKRDTIDIYSSHWPNYDVNIDEIYSALYNLKTKGKIQNIGFCNVSLRDLKTICSLGKVDYVQIEFNVFDRWGQDIIEYCADNGIKCMAYSPLDQGISCDSENSKKILSAIAKKYNATIFQVVLSWIMYKDIIPIFTSKSKEHIKENIDSKKILLSNEEITTIDTLGAKIEYINTDMIIPTDGGHYDRTTCKTLEDAKKNTMGYCPSPESIARYLLQGNSIKPLKVSRIDKQYKLIEGRCRYWGWQLAFGASSAIPAYIRETKV